MTSIAAESVSTILVSCKQTRFHIESPNHREVMSLLYYPVFSLLFSFILFVFNPFFFSYFPFP
jgi:hypothetical protein